MRGFLIRALEFGAGGWRDCRREAPSEFAEQRKERQQVMSGSRPGILVVARRVSTVESREISTRRPWSTVVVSACGLAVGRARSTCLPPACSSSQSQTVSSSVAGPSRLRSAVSNVRHRDYGSVLWSGAGRVGRATPAAPLDSALRNHNRCIGIQFPRPPVCFCSMRCRGWLGSVRIRRRNQSARGVLRPPPWAGDGTCTGRGGPRDRPDACIHRPIDGERGGRTSNVGVGALILVSHSCRCCSGSPKPPTQHGRPQVSGG